MAINISKHFRKKFWVRRIPKDAVVKMPTNAEHYIPLDYLNGDPVQPLTQSDFMREIETSAHSINERYQSTRPIQELVEKEVAITNEDGTVTKEIRKEWAITGYDELETARFGYQKRFALTKATHAAGDGFSINNEQMDKSEKAHKRFDVLNSHKDIAGLDMALMEVHLSCNQTGDAGLYLYATPSGEIDYKVYSFLDGYEIFPNIDDKGDPIYYILYSIEGKPACDIHSTEFFQTWVLADTPKEDIDMQTSWWGKVKGLFSPNKDSITSEDGWVRVSHKERQIGERIGQFSYFRLRDIPSGTSQLDIEAAERNMSFVLEGVKSATFDTLFIKATDVECLPPIGSHGSVIGVKGDVDSLKASDAKRLAPSDISNVATIAQKELRDSIMHSTMSVIIDPEVLRSGADSSSAMKLCFNDEVKYAMAMQPTFYKPLKHVVTVLKYLVAKIEKDPEYVKLRVSITQNVWVPQNFSENVDNVTKMKYAGLISAENGRHELDMNYPDDMSIIRKEADEELYQKTYVPLQAKHDAEQEFGITDVADDTIVVEPDDNPTKPGVDNKATRK